MVDIYGNTRMLLAHLQTAQTIIDSFHIMSNQWINNLSYKQLIMICSISWKNFLLLLIIMADLSIGNISSSIIMNFWFFSSLDVVLIDGFRNRWWVWYWNWRIARANSSIYSALYVYTSTRFWNSFRLNLICYPYYFKVPDNVIVIIIFVLFTVTHIEEGIYCKLIISGPAFIVWIIVAKDTDISFSLLIKGFKFSLTICFRFEWTSSSLFRNRLSIYIYIFSHSGKKNTTKYRTNYRKSDLVYLI